MRDMDTILIICSVVVIVFGILEIILFFKMWGMTNDVKDIKDRLSTVYKTKDEILQEQINARRKVESTAVESDFKVGETVEYPPMHRVMTVKSIHEDGRIECYSVKENGKEVFEGVYRPDQIIHIDL